MSNKGKQTSSVGKAGLVPDAAGAGAAEAGRQGLHDDTTAPEAQNVHCSRLAAKLATILQVLVTRSRDKGVRKHLAPGCKEFEAADFAGNALQLAAAC